MFTKSLSYRSLPSSPGMWATALVLALPAFTGALRAGIIDVPRISRADFNQHVRELQLDEGQMLPAEAIFEAYLNERAGADRARATIVWWIAKLAPQPCGRVKEEEYELARLFSDDFDSIEQRWLTAIRQLEANYFLALGALDFGLDETIERLKRRRLRATLLRPEALPPGVVTGVSSDLLGTLRNLAIDTASDPALNRAVLDYELSLDRVLGTLDRVLLVWEYDTVRRRRRMISAAEDLGEEGARREIDRYVQVFAQPYELCSDIRSLHEHALDTLLPLLPPADADRLRGQANLRLYPFVYDNSRPLDLTESAGRWHDLTSDQQEGLDAIRGDFLAKRTEYGRRIGRLYRDCTSDRYYRASFLMHALARVRRDPAVITPLPEQVAFDEAVEDWKRQVQRVEQQILDMLSPEQRKRLQ